MQIKSCDLFSPKKRDQFSRIQDSSRQEKKIPDVRSLKKFAQIFANYLATLFNTLPLKFATNYKKQQYQLNPRDQTR